VNFDGKSEFWLRGRWEAISILVATGIFFFSFSILNLSTFNLFHLSNISSIDEIAIPIGNISMELTTKVYGTSSIIDRSFTSTQDIKEFLL
jgi:hypothetical protein